MNKTYEARLNMFDAVNAFCNDNPIITATVPAFQDTLTDFQSIVDSIHSTAYLEAGVIKGITADKKELRLSLCEAAANLASVVYSYASSTDNNELKEKANFSVSSLKKMKDGMLASVCINIEGIANDNLAALADYGITAASLNDFDDQIKIYVGKASSPRNAVSQRASYSKTLKSLSKQANDLLKNQLDKIAVQFKKDYPDFYATYANNRIIVNPASSATQIAGIITSTNNEPVAGALVEIVGQSVSITTDAQGSFDLKPVGVGICSVKISKQGFADDVIDNVSVKLGKTTKLNAAIAPVAA
ncbi:MAG TPA: carboxypeptidase-like regulatory domain-containing protein [Puia sp.]|nr:carboxypeptidase-like regulatory domain-containing protein [Puia sp.]